MSPAVKAPAITTTRPPRSLLVVRDPRPSEIGLKVDWSQWHLTDEEDMSESFEARKSSDVLKSSIEQLGREREWAAVLVGADQFFAWLEEEPLVRVSPDVYILDDPLPEPRPPSWQMWLPGHKPPRLAVEIVSPDTWRKDYDDNPPKYAQLGAKELVIFDPEATTGEARERERVPLTVYRREPDGAFVRVYAGRGPAWSGQLGAWIVSVHDGKVARARISRDEAGNDLVPTAEEARDAAEEALVGERRARADAEREATRLREELERLRGK